MIKDEPEGPDRKAEVHRVSLGVPRARRWDWDSAVGADGGGGSMCVMYGGEAGIKKRACWLNERMKERSGWVRFFPLVLLRRLKNIAMPKVS